MSEHSRGILDQLRDALVPIYAWIIAVVVVLGLMTVADREVGMWLAVLIGVGATLAAAYVWIRRGYVEKR
jgi:hypothetical protein